MAQLTITVPDAQVDRVKAAFAPRIGKDVADVTAEDIRQVVVDLVKRVVRAYEANEATDAAVAAVTDVDAT